MSKFKVGDKVKCIKMKPNYNNKLVVGEIYTVREISSVWLMVKEESNSYEIDCFELVQEKEKHYKWMITFTDLYSGISETIKESEHYVSPKKINDYLKYLRQGDYLSSIVKIEDKFVEDQ